MGGAEYLRLPSETVKEEAAQGQIPGRQIRDSWRFLRDALDERLSTHDSHHILLQQAGIFAEDDTVDDMLADIYAEHGRPAVAVDG